MPNLRLTKIDSFLTEFEAKAACNRLQEHGVEAYIEGAAGQTALSHIGPALSGVRLLVDQENAMLAKQILLDQDVADAGPWTCGTCFSEVDAGFEVCWKCGSLRSEAEWLPEEEEGELRPDELSYRGDGDESGEPDRSASDNPYQVPGSQMTEGQVTGAEASTVVYDAAVELQLQQEALVERAWKACILGLVILPVVAHLYALWVLLSATLIPAEFSRRAKTRFRMTLWISIAAILFCSLLLAFSYF